MNIHQYLDRLRTLDPSDVDFHAERYTSGEHFQNAIIAAHDGDHVLAEEECALAEAAGVDDGADAGTIPCLGGDPASVWNEWFMVDR